MAEKRRIKEAIKRKFPVIDTEASLQEAMVKMADHNVSVLAVKVDQELIGIVTVSDVMYSLAHGDVAESTPVNSFMTPCEFNSTQETRNPLVQLDEDEDARTAIKVMYEAGINHLLVSGSGGEPVGIVSSLEIIKLLARQPQLT